MGEAVDRFLEMYRRGQIVGDDAISAMAARAVAADQAAGRATGRRPVAASRRSPVPADADGKLTDDEADLLFAPKTLEASDARFAAADRRSEVIASMTDEELYQAYRAAAGDSQGSGPGVRAAAAAHEPFTGSHSHAHPAYDGDGSSHQHQHQHSGDASHDPSTGQHVELPSTSHPELGDGA